MVSRDEKIGKNIARLRGDGISQKELAEKMAARGWKWSQATVWSVESGRRPLRLAEATDVCWILEVQIGQLELDSGDIGVVHYTGQYFRSIDVLQDAVARVIGRQLELAQQYDEGMFLEGGHRLDDARQEALLDGTVGMDDIAKVVERELSKALAASTAHLETSSSPFRDALLKAWSDALGVDYGQHPEAP